VDTSDKGLLEWLLGNGETLEKDSNGKSALTLASQQGKIDVVLLLANHFGETVHPVDIAAEHLVSGNLIAPGVSIKLLSLAEDGEEAGKLTRTLVEKLLGANASSELKTFVNMLVTKTRTADGQVTITGDADRRPLVFGLYKALGELKLITDLITKAPGTAALLLDSLFSDITFCNVHKAQFREATVLAFDHVPEGHAGGVMKGDKPEDATGAVCKRLEVRGILNDRNKVLSALANLHTSSPLLTTVAVKAIIQYHW
jgi:hypothetical protein